MKAFNRTLVLAALALNTVACGFMEEEEESTPIIITTETFAGIYEGKTSYVSNFADYSESDIFDARVSIVESKDNASELLITDLVEDCVVVARDMGDWLAVDEATCVTEDADFRFTLVIEGEGEFTRAGKLQLDLWGTSTFEEKVHYSHGAEWEALLNGETKFEFEGRGL